MVSANPAYCSLTLLAQRFPAAVPEELGLEDYRMATGLTGEPVPPTTRRGLMVSMNS